MKKLMLVGLAIVVSATLYAHGGGGVFNSDERYADSRKAMDEMHEVMHNTSVISENSDKGVVFEITSTSDSASNNINKSFVEEQSKLEDFFQGVNVDVEAMDNGIRLILESDDESLVRRLQKLGSHSVYQYLHTGFEIGRFGRGYQVHGPGMMFGYGKGRGYGHGPCHGYDYQDEGNPRSQPGSMRWKGGWGESGYRKM